MALFFCHFCSIIASYRKSPGIHQVMKDVEPFILKSTEADNAWSRMFFILQMNNDSGNCVASLKNKRFQLPLHQTSPLHVYGSRSFIFQTFSAALPKSAMTWCEEVISTISLVSLNPALSIALKKSNFLAGRGFVLQDS